ncbi:MAG: DUF3164 family protein [Alphaproteobacteria bacterium]|nr:DUF3164 family protein [Alphaproteobacteria bacterium]
MTNRKIPEGAIELHGQHYLRDASGSLVPIDNIKPVDLLMDEMVRKMVGYAEDLSAELARFLSHSNADIAAFDALIDQEYGVKRPEKTKGNRTFTSYDGNMMVKVAVADRIQLGPELQAAKKLLDALILERAEGADPLLVSLVNQAFGVEQEGRVDVQAILALRRRELPDPRWADIKRAIDDSIRVVGSKGYLRFYARREAGEEYRMIPMNLAAIEVTPVAFDRRSLRRSVEEAGDDVSVAVGALQAGLFTLAASRLQNALKALGKPAVSPEDFVAWLDAAARWEGLSTDQLAHMKEALQWLLDEMHTAGETHDSVTGHAFPCVLNAAKALIAAGGSLQWFPDTVTGSEPLSPADAA